MSIYSPTIMRKRGIRWYFLMLSYIYIPVKYSEVTQYHYQSTHTTPSGGCFFWYFLLFFKLLIGQRVLTLRDNIVTSWYGLCLKSPDNLCTLF